VSIEISKTLYCDYCKQYLGFGLLDVSMSISEQRKCAKKQGWVREWLGSGQIDVCNNCKAKEAEK
jgi:hypothetical protein